MYRMLLAICQTLSQSLELQYKIILKQMLNKTWCEGVQRTHLAQDKVQWQTLVNMIKNLHVL